MERKQTLLLGENPNTGLCTSMVAKSEASGNWSEVKVVTSLQEGIATASLGIARVLTNGILPSDWENPHKPISEGVDMAIYFANMFLKEGISKGNVGIYFLLNPQEIDEVSQHYFNQGILLFDLKRVSTVRAMERFVRGDDVWSERVKRS